MLRMAWRLIPAHRTDFISRRGRGTREHGEGGGIYLSANAGRRGHIACRDRHVYDVPSIHATRKSFTLPGSNPPHGNPAIEVKTGRAY
jgi:hypothetical protein